MKKKIICLFIAICIMLQPTIININAEPEELNLNALSAVLIDAENGRILYAKDPHEKKAMASTTKIMTCIIALEYGNLDDTVTFSAYAASMPRVRMDGKEGEQYKLKDLLYSLMLESHNDTAVAIAEHISGSVEAFAALMNEKASQLGMNNTNFVTPNGLDADGHYSTAYDMALVGAYAINNERFIEITNTASHSFSELNGKRNVTVSNKDAFLTMMDGAIGIKTGFTGQAGYCFVGALDNGEHRLVSTVLGSGWPPNKSFKWRDTQSLIKYGIENYSEKKIFEGIDTFETIPVEDGKESGVETYVEGEYSLLLAEYENVACEANIRKVMYAPVKEGQNVGSLNIMIDGEKIVSFPICAKENVEKIDFLYCLKKAFDTFLL